MATNIINAIQEYKQGLISQLNEMQNPEASKAFKGSDLESALKRFIDSVIVRGSDYINHLTNAQEQIIKSVYEIYGVQISAVSDSLIQDSRYGEGAPAPSVDASANTPSTGVN